jgi:hypothetical protein
VGSLTGMLDAADPAELDAADPAELPLTRNRNFQLLWSDSAFACLGREITDLVYPLVIPAVTGLGRSVQRRQLFVSLLVGLPPARPPTGMTGASC